jgi:hypothetical protein
MADKREENVKDALTVDDLKRLGDPMGVVIAVISEMGLLKKFEEESSKVYEAKEPIITMKDYELAKKRVLKKEV